MFLELKVITWSSVVPIPIVVAIEVVCVGGTPGVYTGIGMEGVVRVWVSAACLSRCRLDFLRQYLSQCRCKASCLCSMMKRTNEKRGLVTSKNDWLFTLLELYRRRDIDILLNYHVLIPCACVHPRSSWRFVRKRHKHIFFVSLKDVQAVEKCLLPYQNVGVPSRPPTPWLYHLHLRQGRTVLLPHALILSARVVWQLGEDGADKLSQVKGRRPTSHYLFDAQYEDLRWSSIRQKTWNHFYFLCDGRVDWKRKNYEHVTFLCHVYYRGGGKNLDWRSHWPKADWGLVWVLSYDPVIRLVLLWFETRQKASSFPSDASEGVMSRNPSVIRL